MIVQAIEYVQTEEGAALEQRLAAFAGTVLQECPFAAPLVLHGNRNIFISNMAWFMRKFTDVALERELQGKIVHFLAGEEWIIGAARMLRKDNTIYTLQAPDRHRHIVDDMKKQKVSVEDTALAYDGFAIYKAGTTTFLNRFESMALAKANGQLNARLGSVFHDGKELYTEDLWV